VPAFVSQIRPLVMLPAPDSARLLQGAANHDVRAGGYVAAERVAAQVWSGPFDGPRRSPGTALHLGSVDWLHDFPARDEITLRRVILTHAGVAAGETTVTILDRIVALAGLAVDPQRVATAVAPARDPFRAPFRAGCLTSDHRADPQS
jgi:hypothetical protein